MSNNDPLTTALMERIDRLVAIGTELNKARRLRALAAAEAERMPKETKVVPATVRERGDIKVEIRAIGLTDGNGKPTGRTTERNVIVRVTNLEKMWKRGEITFPQRLAGERLARTYENGQASIKSVLDLDTVRGGGSTGGTDALADAGAMLITAHAAIRRAFKTLGPELAHIVVWVAICGRTAAEWAELRGLQSRSGTDILRLGLNVLITHYRIDSD